MREKSVTRPVADEAVPVGGEHCAALADVERVLARAQPNQIIMGMNSH